MINNEEVRKVAQYKIDNLGGYLVECQVTSNNNINIFFDSLDGVSIDHCLQVSRFVQDHFSEDIEDYELTVCSAGLDRPFLVKEQYYKNKGKEVGVLLKDGKRKKGIILEYDNGLLLEEKKKKKGSAKKYITQKIFIPENSIKETNIKINFK